VTASRAIDLLLRLRGWLRRLAPPTFPLPRPRARRHQVMWSAPRTQRCAQAQPAGAGVLVIFFRRRRAAHLACYRDTYRFFRDLKGQNR
jgi:hypothetical protein